MPPLSPDDHAALARARAILESPSLAIRLTDTIGSPIEALVRRLPDGAQRVVADGTRRALEAALDAALRTLDGRRTGKAADWLHRGAVVASGAVGGAAGLAGLVVELPFSLTVMLRSIADHGRAQGEDLSGVAARLECLTVFAYGTRSRGDDAADAGYFAIRATLARAVSHAAEYVAERGLAEALSERSAPALLQLVARITQRLGIAVTDKAAAQLVPVLGAAGGAAVNALFMSHYQETAWAHFTIRRLERLHGAGEVRRAYEAT
ncbi:EcsC family protein [Anaeromyxobacter oryzae]|nr:EcsC family protein [Anaeromyxobacter oryzae]